MSNMPRCKTCKWWERDMEAFGHYDDYEDEPVDGWGICALTASKGNDRPTEPFTLAYALDHESYLAELTTHEDFGCVQHEPKDEQP